jgi:phage terminase large subunit-like protein
MGDERPVVGEAVMAIDWRAPVAGFDPWKNPGGATFHQDTAERVCAFFPERFKHSKGTHAGDPFVLEPWQQQVIGHTFGWKKPDGNRRFRFVWIYIPRKNGKSTLAAGIVLVMLVADGEPGAEVYLCAAEREQASLVYNEAAHMVEQDDVLSENIIVRPSTKLLRFDDTMSICRVLSSDADTKHGLNPSAAVIDEVHAQKKPDLMEVIETGIGARAQPLLTYLTTADFARPSPCNTKLEYAKAVRDGTIEDPAFFPVIYEADREDDWTDPAIWRKANPNYGVSLREEYMQDQCRKAQADPSFENTFKRLHLNMQTEQAKRWLQMAKWDACKDDVTEEQLLGAKCFGGADLSTTTDLSCFALYFPDFHAVKCWFFCPEDTASSQDDSKTKGKVRYRRWIDSGHIIATPGNVIDYEYIQAQAAEAAKVYSLQDVGYDTYNATQFAIQMQHVEGIEMVQFRQGYASMNEPSKEFAKLVIQGMLRHMSNPVLRWMASNVAIMEDPAGNVKPIKPSQSSPLKIDGIVAVVMAIGRAMATAPKRKSIYEERGLIVL